MTAVEIENVLATPELHELVEQAEQNGSLRYAELLQRIPPLYIKAVKGGMYRSIEKSATKAERDFMEYIYPQQQSGAVEESLAAFREKREPDFWGEPNKD